ncbi:EndoU domain-containing protein [Agromyces larvae]|uniref:EndoU domain-containing protein n=2 Tax=Agromyces larvae TaxID=2929802 RepID=A0ABY4C4H9_9MICO|nr:EndoU domain-containing protein [Agromyces larvae]
MLEIGVGVALSFLTAGVGAAATAAKIAFTVGRWALRIAEVCRRLATLVRGALAAARITGRGAAHLVKDSIASGVAAVAAQIGFSELRAAVDPRYEPQNVGDILGGGLLAAAIAGVPGAGPANKRISPATANDAALLGSIDEVFSEQRRIHILYGDKTGGGHLHPAQPGKTPFPESWTGERIIDAVLDIATDPTLEWSQTKGIAGQDFTRNGAPSRYSVIGNRDGIDILVSIEPRGEGIITAFPTEKK